MQKIKHHIALLTTITLLWMIVLPLLSVCGNMLYSYDSSDNSTVTCCPKSVEKTSISLSLITEHSENKSHNCTVCPCEYRATIMASNSLALIVPPSQDVPLLLLSVLLVQDFALDTTAFSNYSSLLNPPLYSEPPLFIRNCTYLI